MNSQDHPLFLACILGNSWQLTINEYLTLNNPFFDQHNGLLWSHREQKPLTLKSPGDDRNRKQLGHETIKTFWFC